MTSKEKNPAVSVIIPTYNHRDYICDTLASVFAQTFADYEVIVVNDGSPDQTADVLKTHIENGQIRYFEQLNQGQAAARNRGLAEARGEFIAFLDDDDLWPVDKLQWQTARLKVRADLGMVGGTCVRFKDSHLLPDDSEKETVEITFESLFCGSPFTSPGQTLIRASSLIAAGGFDTSIWGADDLDLYMRLARSAKIECMPRVALHYRVHESNASKNVGKMMRNAQKTILKNLRHVPVERKKRAEDNGFFWLYEYSGKQFVRNAKLDLKSGRWMSCLRHLMSLRGLYFQMLKRPRLARAFLRDMTPVELRGNSLPTNRAKTT